MLTLKHSHEQHGRPSARDRASANEGGSVPSHRRTRCPGPLRLTNPCYYSRYSRCLRSNPSLFPIRLVGLVIGFATLSSDCLLNRTVRDVSFAQVRSEATRPNDSYEQGGYDALVPRQNWKGRRLSLVALLSSPSFLISHCPSRRGRRRRRLAQPIGCRLARC